MAITMNLGTSSHGNGVIFHQNPPYFGDTSLTERSIGTGPPVIIQLSGFHGEAAVFPQKSCVFPWRRCVFPRRSCNLYGKRLSVTKQRQYSTERFDFHGITTRLCGEGACFYGEELALKIILSGMGILL